MCSNDETPDEETPIENSDDVTPSDDISTLYIANMLRSRKGQRIKITDTRSAPVHGEATYRQSLNIPDSVSIYAISGGAYNKDGSYPKTEKDSYEAYSTGNYANRPNVTISFIFCEESQANATLKINEAMTFDTQSWTLPFESSSVREIKTGSLTITAKDERLQDAITPLGVDKDGNIIKSFKLNDENMTYTDNGTNYVDPELNALKYSTETNNDPIDITHTELVDKFKTQGNIIPIKIIETATVHGGKRIEPASKPI